MLLIAAVESKCLTSPSRHPVIVLMLPGAILSARRRAENVNSKG
jgi:hypothetical protein